MIILAITGCANKEPIRSNQNVPKVTKLRAMSDRNAIALEWNIVNKPEIAGYYIQRSEDKKHYKTIKKIESKFITHWTDRGLKPATYYFYKIATYTKEGVPSVAKYKEVKTLPTISPMPFVAKAKFKSQNMIKIIFRPHPNERVKGYIVERMNNSGKWEKIATIEPRLSAEFIDKNLEKGHTYTYRIIAYTFDGLKSAPSKSLIITTQQGPKVIVKMQITNDLVKKIKLSWEKVPEAVKYKIYYSNSKNGDFKLLTTTSQNIYIDNLKKDGKIRFYKISSLDKNGIESLKSSVIMGSTIDIPQKPVVSVVEKDKKHIKFLLSSVDKRAVKYLIIKENRDKILKIHNVKSPFIDKNVKKGESYIYKFFAIDKDGLISKAKELGVTF